MGKKRAGQRASSNDNNNNKRALDRRQKRSCGRLASASRSARVNVALKTRSPLSSSLACQRSSSSPSSTGRQAHLLAGHLIDIETRAERAITLAIQISSTSRFAGRHLSGRNNNNKQLAFRPCDARAMAGGREKERESGLRTAARMAMASAGRRNGSSGTISGA